MCGPVRPVLHERPVGVCGRDDLGAKRDFPAHQAGRIPGSVDPLMVVKHILGHRTQVREGLEKILPDPAVLLDLGRLFPA